VLASALLVAVAGCGDDGGGVGGDGGVDGSDSSDGSDGGDGGGCPDVATAVVGASGGTVSVTCGPAAGASVVVPAGALASDVTLTIAAAPAATGVPAGFTAAGPTIEFGPTGTTFAVPVTVTVPVTTPATSMFTQTDGSSTWTRITDATGGATAVSGPTTHFSPFFGANGMSVLTSIDITPGMPSITAGARIQLFAAGTFSDGTTQDLTAVATWASSMTGVATISAAGLASSTMVGTTTITATAGGVTGTTTLHAISFNRGVNGFDGKVHSVIEAPDGTGDIYVGGEFTTYDGHNSPGVARLHADGTFDTSFSVGTGFQNTLVYALAAAPGGANDLPGGDQDIYVTGAFGTYNGAAAAKLVRLKPDGTVNPGFVVGTGLSGLGNPTGYSLLAAADGSGDIYVGGQITEWQGTPSNTVARIHSDGTINAAFAVGSGLTLSSGTPVASVMVADGAGGDILVGGMFDAYKGAAVNSLVRLHGDGSLEPTFGNNATATAFIGSSVQVLSIVLDASGAVFVGGAFANFPIPNGAPQNINIVRLDHNGMRNISFDVGRGIETNFVATILLAIDGSNDVYAGGFFNGYRYDLNTGTGFDFDDLLRINGDGTADLAFATGTNFHYPTGQVVYALVPVRDGSGDVYVGGSFTTFGATPVQHLARMSPSGAIR
jgi:hypothetical protein